MSFAPDLSHFKQGAFVIEGEKYAARGEEWYNGTFNDKSVPIYPGIYQNTSRYLDMLVDLHKRLEPIPTCFDQKSGFWFSSRHQVLGNWGCLQTPILCPMEDNSQLRKDFELRSPDSEELTMIEKLFDRVLDQGEHSALHIRKKSSAGFPTMIVGAEFKRARFNLVKKFVRDILATTAHLDYRWRYQLIGSYPLYTNGIRLQMDTIKLDENGVPYTKQRYTYRKQAVIRGTFTDDDRIPIIQVCRDIDGNLRTDVVCARVRSMYALTYDDNVLMGILNNFIYNGAKKVIKPLCYEGEVKLSKQIKEFLNYQEGVVFTLDKSQFGETFNPQVMELFYSAIKKRWPLLAECVRNTIDAVVCLRAYDKGDSDVIFTRRTFEKELSKSLKGSFKSGHGLVAILGKLLGAIDAMLICRRAFGASFDLEAFLSNTDQRYRYFGSGDDTLFVAKTEIVANAIKAAVVNKASLHLDELEEVAKYLGVIYDNYGNTSFDLRQYLETAVGAERSYKTKPNHRIGISCRVQRASLV